jgi:hypothetical protein
MRAEMERAPIRAIGWPRKTPGLRPVRPGCRGCRWMRCLAEKRLECGMTWSILNPNCQAALLALRKAAHGMAALFS